MAGFTATAMGGAAPPSNNVYIDGMPAEMDEPQVKAAFEPYGTLKAARRVNQTLWMLSFATMEDAQWLVENLNGNIPQGMSAPVQVRFAQLGPAQPQAAGFAGGTAGGFRATPYGGAPAVHGKGGCVFGMGGGPAAGGPPEGEVRFADMMSAQGALALTGTALGGSAITVVPDPTSTDGTKVTVTGFGPQVMWQELKDHFRQCGDVIFADVKGKPSGKGFGKGFGKGQGLGPGIGEVRMSTADEALLAVQLLNGSQLGGGTIGVTMHANSTDNTKLAVTGVPPGVSWQDLKDYFKQCGTVMHADTAQAAPMQGMQGAGGHPGTGEVRYDDPQQAMVALQALNGSQLGSSKIFIAMDPGSTDQSKLTVTGIAPGIGWRELKDHFGSVGQVAFADVHKGGGKAGGWKGGGGGGFVPFGGAKGGGGGGFVPFGGGGGAGFSQNGAFGGGAGKGGGGGQSFPRVPGALTGIVRFETPDAAQMALAQMNGAFIGAGQITVDSDWNSQDGTKLWLGGIPPGTDSQELKDAFAQFGPIAFANVNKGKGKGAN